MQNRRGHTIVLLFLLFLAAVFLVAFMKTCAARSASVVHEAVDEKPTPIAETIPLTSGGEPVAEPLPDIASSVSPAAASELPPEETPAVLHPPVRPFAPTYSGPPAILPLAALEPLAAASSPVDPESTVSPEFPPQEQVSVPKVPDMPFIFEPSVFTLDDWYTFFVDSEPAPSSSDDPFADFFVSGEDAMVYDDGWYYMGLYINDEYSGDIEVQLEADQQALNSSELSLMLDTLITDDAYRMIFSAGEQYIPLDTLRNLGIGVDYDPAMFTVGLTFGIDMMPVKNISVSTSYISRRDRYSLSGSQVLAPAKFSWISHLSLYSALDFTEGELSTSQLFSLSVANNLSIFGVGLDFSYQLSQNDPYFTFGSWRGFYDFADKNIRMSFGNIGSGIGSYSGTYVGLAFEKNYSYGTGSAKSNQYERTITLPVRSSVEVIMNERSVFKRELAAGTYRLKDFLFSQGANSIDVIITPVNPMDGESYTIHVDMGYDSRLLARNESLWGMSFSLPREEVTAGSGIGISLPWIGGKELDYRPKQFSAQYWQQTGITDIFTLSTTFSVTPGLFLSNFSGVLATTFGTVQGATALSLSPLGVGYSGKLSHRYSASNSWFNSIDASIGYTNGTYSVTPSETQIASVGLLTGALSFSGRIGSFLRISVGSNVSLAVDTFSPDWSIVTSLGMSPAQGMSLSASIVATATGEKPDKPVVKGSLSFSYSFGSAAALSVSTDFRTGNSINFSWRPGVDRRDTLQLNLSGIDFSNPIRHTLSLGWSHIGDLYSMTLRQQFSDSYQRAVTYLSLNTSFIFADGVFGMSRNISDNFLLIKPTGSLKGGSISVGRSMDSSPSVLPTVFGAAVYNNISSYTRNNVIVFGSSGSLFGSGDTFVYEMTPRSRQGFVAKISMQPSYTVSGRLFTADGQPYDQYSSPVYKFELDEQGMPVLTPVDEYYLFTDQEGRFIISDMQPGQYLFDLQVQDSWYAVRFDVPVFSARDKADETVLVLGDYYEGDPALVVDYTVLDADGAAAEHGDTDVFGTLLASEYNTVVQLTIDRRMNEQSFWDSIFPTFDSDPFFDGAATDLSEETE